MARYIPELDVGEMNLGDDVELRLGTDNDFRVRFNSSSGKMEITDGTNVLWSLTDSGTTGLLEVFALGIGGGSSISSLGRGEAAPTVTDVANCGTISSVAGGHVRVGNTVIQAVSFTAAVTTNGVLCNAAVSNAVASNFTAANQARGGGSAVHSGGAPQAVWVGADSTNDRINLFWMPISDANNLVSVVICYPVL